MSQLSQYDPTGRFTGLADKYARYRPDYPPAAIDFIMNRCQLGANSLLVDVGCGTGLSSQLLALRGVPVIGIEPNEDMRKHAESASLLPNFPAPSYRDGRAEATGLPDGVADAVLAAQAFHWFDAGKALREFHRILKADGWVVLMWNERDEVDSFTAAYGRVVGGTPEAAALEAHRSRAGEALLHNPLFQHGERICYPHQQFFDEETMLGRAFSTSYAPRQPAEAEHFAARLRDVFAQFQRDGKTVLRYQTTLYLARRSARSSDL